MQAIIVAGGKGTRLKPLTDTVPKLLLPLQNIPLLDYLIEHVKLNGCDNLILCLGNLGGKVEQYLNNKDYGIPIKISMEDKPLGTAGSIREVYDSLEDEFFVLYGDVYTTINLRQIHAFHKAKNADATLALHVSDHPHDSTIVKIDSNKRIVRFVEKPGEMWMRYSNVTTTPLYVLKKDILQFIKKDRKIDFTKDVFPQMLRKSKKLFGYITHEYAKDIGTEERYRQVQHYVRKSSKNVLL